MILFPLMNAWIWFQLFEASMLPDFVPRAVVGRINAETLRLRVPF